MGINYRVKMNTEVYFCSFAIRATGTCTCRVSAVSLKALRIQCFDKF